MLPPAEPLQPSNPRLRHIPTNNPLSETLTRKHQQNQINQLLHALQQNLITSLFIEDDDHSSDKNVDMNTNNKSINPYLLVI